MTLTSAEPSTSQTPTVHLADPAATVAQLSTELRQAVRSRRLRGAVVAVSGGIDSAACLALAAKTFGPEKCLGLFLPDHHSESESKALATELCATFGVELITVDISPTLAALGCYEHQNHAVISRVADFDPAQDTFRVDFHQDFTDAESLPRFGLTVIHGDGRVSEVSLTGEAYLELIAATNMKQRTRMLLTHFYAEARHAAVVGTSNRLEVEQGFFVRHGDGTGDHLPLRHLLKTHVYDIARELGVPEGILGRTPTTDTYSAPQTQEEFFYGLPLELNDVLWDAFASGADPAAVADSIGQTTTWVEAVFGAYHRRQVLAQRLLADTLA